MIDKNLRRYCLTLDLIEDAASIAKYRWHHERENQWPEINASIREAGVENMEIFLFGNRMFMIMDVNESFSFEKMHDINQRPITVEWENLMWGFQKAIPGAKPGEKWVLMEQIYKLP